MSDEPGASFGRDSLVAVLSRACETAGLDPAGAELLRLGQNAIYRLGTAPVVVRVARGPEYFPTAVKELHVAEWLADAGIAAARPWDVVQPLDVAGHPVTFWRYIKGRRGRPEDVAALGLLLRRLHALPRPQSFDLPPDNVLDRIEPRVARAPLSAADRAFLLDLFADLRAEVKALAFPLPTSVIHGDAHVQNLMVDDAGTVLLIDFERVAIGQPEWDLAMTATEFVTAGFWTAEQYDEFVNSYRFDIRSWDGFETLRRVHEVKMTTWLMQNINESQEIRDEFDRRMATIRDRRADLRWTPF